MKKNITNSDNFVIDDPDGLKTRIQRRSFLRYAGAGAAALTVLAACKKSADNNITTTKPNVDLGSGDNGILNFAYALEQVEAAFYTQVIATPYTGITGAETTLLTAIRDHEIAHREFYKATLGTNALAALTPDFTSINFTDKTTVLSAARGFEDLGVAAYNGVAYLIKNAGTLALAGKIVSVEARHSAVIRNLLAGTAAPYSTFADATVIHQATLSTGVADPYNGLEASRPPSQVLPTVNSYLTVNLTATTLP